MSNTIGKIVELLIDWDDIEFDDTLGLSIMSLVDKPAIGISWQAFAAQQFVDPQDGETEADYIGRCIPTLIEEGFDEQQATAICYNSYKGESFLEDNPCQSGYVAYGTKSKGGRQVPNCIPIENSEMEFETYNDYPESAKNNAQRAIDWAEENGWGSCGTNVGKQRAHQLSKGENISEDTIARMASFARHKKNSDTPYSEGCGKLMWDAWGGTSGIEWAQSKLKRIRQEQSEEDVTDPFLDMVSHSEFGEVLDYTNTIEINQSQANFADLTDTLKAIIGLDILGKKDPSDKGEVKYRYAGPTPQRDFCKAMMRLNKVYTLTELRRMGIQVGNGIDQGQFAITRWHGGPNCRHYFEQVRVFREGRRTVVVSEGRASGDLGKTMESRPRGGYQMSQWNFSEDDQMIITGPAMTPLTLIPRKDGDGNIFHVYFTEDTIKKIYKKFFEYNKQHNTDINHDDNVTNDNTLLESWIVEDPDMDKSKLMGFNVPKNTWMVSYKINDEETWQKIKDGELSGFSITGQFIEKATRK